MCFFFFKQKTAYEVRISDWSSDVCSSDLPDRPSYPEKSYTEKKPVQGVEEKQPRQRADQSSNATSLDFDNVIVNEGALEIMPDGYGFLQIGRASCRERVCQYV